MTILFKDGTAWVNSAPSAVQVRAFDTAVYVESLLTHLSSVKSAKAMRQSVLTASEVFTELMDVDFTDKVKENLALVTDDDLDKFIADAWLKTRHAAMKVARSHESQADNWLGLLEDVANNSVQEPIKVYWPEGKKPNIQNGASRMAWAVCSGLFRFPVDKVDHPYSAEEIFADAKGRVHSAASKLALFLTLGLDKDLNQSQVALATGLTRSHVSQGLNGLVKAVERGIQRDYILAAWQSQALDLYNPYQVIKAQDKAGDLVDELDGILIKASVVKLINRAFTERWRVAEFVSIDLETVLKKALADGKVNASQLAGLKNLPATILDKVLENTQKPLDAFSKDAILAHAKAKGWL